MRFEFPLLSILSVCVLLFFGLQGDVELYSWEVGVSVSHDEVRVMVDPVWVVWSDKLACNGFAFGNVIGAYAPFRDTWREPVLLDHEYRHVRQLRALSLWAYPLSFFLNIEGGSHTLPGWDGLAMCNSRMWLPPPSWIDQWRFLSVTLHH